MKQIPLSRGKFALVDDADFEYVNQWKWTYHNGGYAYRMKWTPETKKQTNILMHRLILDAHQGIEVDHINGDKLDNRRCNLRLCTRAQNQANVARSRRNKSGCKGVHQYKRKPGKWIAYIRSNKKTRYLGIFDSKLEAAAAYNRAAVSIFGEFAHLNKAVA